MTEAPAGLAPFSGRSRSSLRIKEGLIKALCLACAAVSIVTTLGIIAVLARETAGFFGNVSPKEFFTGREWSPTFANPKFGILPLLCGTFLIAFGAAIVALPLGLLCAVYLREYASARVRKILKPVLELLAGVPTVVYGYFGLVTVTPLLRALIPGVEVFNALSGAIVVGIMVLPLVSSLSEDALSAVPQGLREGGYALGSTKLEVTTKVTVPSALSGIMAGFILALSRAVGETMAVTLAAGQTPKLTLDPRDSIETMTAYIVQISQGDTPNGSLAFQTIFAVGATLFVMTFILNMLAQRLVRKFGQVYR